MVKALFAAALAATFASFARAAEPKYVYAHFMVGIVEKYTVDDWAEDMRTAKAIGIDGFALNCAPTRTDSYTPKQLANAYEAATQEDFKVFISFDFAYWRNDDVNLILEALGNYSSLPSQAMYNGGAIASTFVGEYFDWAPVKAKMNVTAIPMMEDPFQATQLHTSYDGAFSWLAWPTDGGNSVKKGPMTTEWDDKFIENLAGKLYMMPVSPWFSTHFNSKNWVFIAEQLITERWDQVLALQPQLVEIISWNDFGESHYIADLEPNHTDDGSGGWTLKPPMPHAGWRRIMKAYIAAYKSGAKSPVIERDELVYWYRPHLKGLACSNDTQGLPQGQELLEDLVFVTTMLTEDATLTVTSGGASAVTVDAKAGLTTFNFTMGVGKQSFEVSRGGAKLFGGEGGMDIADTCILHNYNAFVGAFPEDESSAPAPPPGPKPPVTEPSDPPTTVSPGPADPPATEPTPPPGPKPPVTEPSDPPSETVAPTPADPPAPLPPSDPSTTTSAPTPDHSCNKPNIVIVARDLEEEAPAKKSRRVLTLFGRLHLDFEVEE